MNLIFATILFGISYNSGIGEKTPAPIISFTSNHLEASGFYVQKLGVPGSAYLIHGNLNQNIGPIGIGIGQSYRYTSQYSKRVTWVRLASRSNKQVQLITEFAPWAYNRQRRIELRVSPFKKKFQFEQRVWVMSHLQGTGFGIESLIGVK
jgi:hypothetical protein